MHKLQYAAEIMRVMAKHSFNADVNAEEILSTVELVLRDKTEFINRLITIHGRATIHTIMREREQALHESLRETPTPPAPYKPSRKGDTSHTRRPKPQTA